MPIQAVIFDLDDTLYPERQYVRSGYRAVADELRARLAVQEPLEQWLWARFLGGEAAGAFDALNERFRLGLTPEEVMEQVNAYRRHAPDIRPYEDVPELLARLHGERRLGLLTDGYLPAQELKLNALRLRRFFDVVVFTEDLGRSAWKPAPDGFEEMAKHLAAPHEACAYVADNPAKDFLAPNALGWRTVRTVRPGQVHAGAAAPRGGEPQFTVHDGGELREALLEPR